MTWSSGAGERWHVSFGNNPTAMNFVLDTYVYLTNPSEVANLELDLNQVTSSGKTIMFDTQCSSYSKTWEYTVVSGSSNHWTISRRLLNPLTWKAKTWHQHPDRNAPRQQRQRHARLGPIWMARVAAFKNAKGYGHREPRLGERHASHQLPGRRIEHTAVDTSSPPTSTTWSSITGSPQG